MRSRACQSASRRGSAPPAVKARPLARSLTRALSGGSLRGLRSVEDLHELTQGTGHRDRLDRLRGRIDDKARAREEPVAELGSAFPCADLGIASSPRADHASYIASWSKLLTDEPRAVFDAATHAQRAVEFLHALHAGNTGAAVRSEAA